MADSKTLIIYMYKKSKRTTGKEATHLCNCSFEGIIM